VTQADAARKLKFPEMLFGPRGGGTTNAVGCFGWDGEGTVWWRGSLLGGLGMFLVLRIRFWILNGSL